MTNVSTRVRKGILETPRVAKEKADFRIRVKPGLNWLPSVYHTRLPAAVTRTRQSKQAQIVSKLVPQVLLGAGHVLPHCYLECFLVGPLLGMITLSQVI